MTKIEDCTVNVRPDGGGQEDTSPMMKSWRCDRGPATPSLYLEGHIESQRSQYSETCALDCRKSGLSTNRGPVLLPSAQSPAHLQSPKLAIKSLLQQRSLVSSIHKCLARCR